MHSRNLAVTDLAEPAGNGIEYTDMDVGEYAKWGIRVKEEPVALDVLHLDNEAKERNLGELDGGWMCKFPRDAQATFSVADTDKLHYELLEPFETSQANHLWEDCEYLNLPISNSVLHESNINDIPQEDTIHTSEKDHSAKNDSGLRNNLEKSDITSNALSSRETLNIIDPTSEKLDSVLTTCADDRNQRESVEFLFERTNCDKLEVAVNVKNKEKLFNSSGVDQPRESTKNVTAAANFLNERDLGTQNCSSEKVASPNGSYIEGTEQQKILEEKNKSKTFGRSGFECPDCGKILRRSSGFLTHMKLHLLQLPHSIPLKRRENCKVECNDRSKVSFHKKVNKYTKRSIHVASDDETSIAANCAKVHLPSHFVETCQKKAEQQQQSYKSEDLLPLNPKRRRQSYSKEHSVSNISVENINSSTQKQDVENNGFDQEWSSEVKCREKQGSQNSSSATLSLRLFRFQRPKIVVKRSQVAVCGESVDKVLNSRYEDNCSSNLSREITPFQEEHMICVNTVNECTSKPIVSEVKKTSKIDSNVRNSTDIHNLSRQQEHFVCSQVNCYSIPCDDPSVPLDNFNCSAKVSKIDRVSDVLCTDACGKLISETCKQLRTRSDLKIRIKPVVVLDRLRLFENHESSKFPQRNTNKSNLNVSVDNHPKKIALEKSFSVSEKCNLNNSEDSPESSALKREVMKHATSDNDSMFQNLNFDALPQYSQKKSKSKCKNMTKISTEPSLKHKGLHSCCDEVYESKPPSESNISIERQYCLKKCYVKLSRICVESRDLGRIEGEHNKTEEIVKDVRTCGKLKLRRTSSKLWTVSTCNPDLENPYTAENSEGCNRTENEQMCISENSDQQFSSSLTLQSQMYDQKSEKLQEDGENCRYESKTFPVRFHRSLVETSNQQKIKTLNNFRSNCTWCQKIFFDEESLAQHLKTHLSGYKCPQCSAKFHFMMELQSHIAGCSLVRLLSCQKTQFPIKHCEVIL